MSRGLLFIGDPHLTCRTPRSRVDQDFLETTTGKLRQALAIANEREAVPVILGDLFDREWENRPAMLAKVLSLLQETNIKVRILAGNHDIHDWRNLEKTTLGVVAASGVAEVFFQPASERIQVGFDLAADVKLEYLPYGFDLPKKIRRERTDAVFLVTHHDIAFPDSPYPGAIEPAEIDGCDYVVNGHIHLPMKAVWAGTTEWHNPGNIVRLTMPEADRTPKVLFWTPENGFESIELSCNRSAFLPKVQSATRHPKKTKQLAFVQRLKSDLEEDKTESGDAGHLIEALGPIAKAQNVSQQAVAKVHELLHQVIAERG